MQISGAGTMDMMDRGIARNPVNPSCSFGVYIMFNRRKSPKNNSTRNIDIARDKSDFNTKITFSNGFTSYQGRLYRSET